MNAARGVIAALTCAALAGPGHAHARPYAGPTAVAAAAQTGAPLEVAPPAAATPPVAAPRDEAPTTVPPPRLDRVRSAARDPRSIAGATAVALGAVAWIAAIVGLGLGANVDDELLPLRDRADLERRRTLLARGALANRLAIGAGVAAASAVAVGIVLMALGRRRERRAAAASAQLRARTP
ncbi:MAG: hypothetical protein K1X88_08265 [Nannocystaceae bacterium]|nr:hypothetical protein [Nannocystaceae bacterium]